jgi:hypothetical protein
MENAAKASSAAKARPLRNDGDKPPVVSPVVGIEHREDLERGLRGVDHARPTIQSASSFLPKSRRIAGI